MYPKRVLRISSVYKDNRECYHNMYKKDFKKEQACRDGSVKEHANEEGKLMEYSGKEGMITCNTNESR